MLNNVNKDEIKPKLWETNNRKDCDFVMAYKYSKSLYDQYEEGLKELNEHKKLLKETNKLVLNLNATIKLLNETIEKQNKIIEEQAQEILRLKSKNNKDSSNLSKPSGTNGYKKVITIVEKSLLTRRVLKLDMNLIH